MSKPMSKLDVEVLLLGGRRHRLALDGPEAQRLQDALDLALAGGGPERLELSHGPAALGFDRDELVAVISGEDSGEPQVSSPGGRSGRLDGPRLQVRSPAQSDQLSLVVPCTAADAVFLGHGLRSVNHQSLLPREVVVALSGVAPAEGQRWRDRWRAVLDERVELVVCDTPEPLVAGLNRQRGAERAAGELISFFDADDLQAPLRLQRIASAFRRPGVKAVYHRFRMHGFDSYPTPDRAAWLAGAQRMYHRGWVSVRAEVVGEVRWTAFPRAQEFIFLEDLVSRFGADSLALLPEFLGVYVWTGFRDQEPLVEQKLEWLESYLVDLADADRAGAVAGG